MGTWSTALYGNDIALDVRENYMDCLKSGMSNAKASRQIAQDYADELEDEYESSIVWCALADTQWKVGRLQKSVRNKALRAIKNGADLPRWEEENTPREVASRRRVLNALKQKLESKPPAEKKIRIKKPVPKPAATSKKSKPPWEQGEIIAFERSRGNLALLYIEGIRKEDYGYETHFSVLDWKGKKPPAASKLQKLPLLLESNSIISKDEDPIPWDRIARLNIKRKGKGNMHFSKHGISGIMSGEACNWKTLPAWIRETSTKKNQKYLKEICGLD